MLLYKGNRGYSIYGIDLNLIKEDENSMGMLKNSIVNFFNVQ